MSVTEPASALRHGIADTTHVQRRQLIRSAGQWDDTLRCSEYRWEAISYLALECMIAGLLGINPR